MWLWMLAQPEDLGAHTLTLLADERNQLLLSASGFVGDRPQSSTKDEYNSPARRMSTYPTTCWQVASMGSRSSTATRCSNHDSTTTTVIPWTCCSSPRRRLRSSRSSPQIRRSPPTRSSGSTQQSGQLDAMLIVRCPSMRPSAHTRTRTSRGRHVTSIGPGTICCLTDARLGGRPHPSIRLLEQCAGNGLGPVRGSDQCCAAVSVDDRESSDNLATSNGVVALAAIGSSFGRNHTMPSDMQPASAVARHPRDMTSVNLIPTWARDRGGRGGSIRTVAWILFRSCVGDWCLVQMF